MSLKLVETYETYSTGDYNETEVFECQNCKRTFHIESGGDIAHCPCEFEEDEE